MTWKRTKLGDVCKIVNGGTPKSGQTEYWGHEMLWLTPKDMGKLTTRYATDTGRKLTKLGLDNCSAKAVPPNSLIMSCRAPIGHVAINVDMMSFNQGCKALVPSDDLNFNYLYYFLISNRDYFNELGSGTTFKELSSKKLSEVIIDVPPLEEQRAIAAKLDAAFSEIDKANAVAQRNAQQVTQLFQNQIDLEFDKKEFEEVTFKDIASIKHGFAFKSEWFEKSGAHVLLTPGNYFESGGYKDRGEKQKYYVGEIPAGYVLRPGSLLLAMTEQAAGLLGSPLIVPEDGSFLHNQRLGLVVENESINIENTCLYFLCNTRKFRKDIFGSGTGIKVRHTSPSKIESTKFRYPLEVEMQRDIAERLTKLSFQTSSLLHTYGDKCRILSSLKSSILSQSLDASSRVAA